MKAHQDASKAVYNAGVETAIGRYSLLDSLSVFVDTDTETGRCVEAEGR